MSDVHTYATHLVWDGSTGAGYRAYSRDHAAVAPPATSSVELSADPAFRGDPARLNPEQLVVMAASSCQLLSFLSEAARAGVDVLSYTDEAGGEMPEDPEGGGPVRITTIRLEPQVLVAAGTDVAEVERLLHVAHERCYVANSLTADVVVRPVVTVAAS